LLWTIAGAGVNGRCPASLERSLGRGCCRGLLGAAVPGPLRGGWSSMGEIFAFLWAREAEAADPHLGVWGRDAGCSWWPQGKTSSWHRGGLPPRHGAELCRLGRTFSESVTVRTVNDSNVQGAPGCRATIGAGSDVQRTQPMEGVLSWETESSEPVPTSKEYGCGDAVTTPSSHVESNAMACPPVRRYAA
jgi:hypothetical protein